MRVLFIPAAHTGFTDGWNEDGWFIETSGKYPFDTLVRGCVYREVLEAEGVEHKTLLFDADSENADLNALMGPDPERNFYTWKRARLGPARPVSDLVPTEALQLQAFWEVGSRMLEYIPNPSATVRCVATLCDLYNHQLDGQGQGEGQGEYIEWSCLLAIVRYISSSTMGH